jgi:2-polyprenyl-6-methoxyphenol hydroxylase-like FAD-dependent oxidoreductase
MVRLERILIAGGGIAGVTAGIAWRRRGFNPEVTEKERPLGPDPPRFAAAEIETDTLANRLRQDAISRRAVAFTARLVGA